MAACRPVTVACAALAALSFALPGGPARADIYGYVDEKGVAHLSSVPLDERYYLFKKEPRGTPSQEADAVIVDPPEPGPGRTIAVSAAQLKLYAPLVRAVAREHRLDPALLHAVITVESGYNPRARSPRGAVGLMQLMPETARRYAVRNIWDPAENLDAGARYLRDLLQVFGNNLHLALAAYNAGEAAVIHHGHRIPPYPETRSYVPSVLHHYRLYRNTGRW